MAINAVLLYCIYCFVGRPKLMFSEIMCFVLGCEHSFRQLPNTIRFSTHTYEVKRTCFLSLLTHSFSEFQRSLFNISICLGYNYMLLNKSNPLPLFRTLFKKEQINHKLPKYLYESKPGESRFVVIPLVTIPVFNISQNKKIPDSITNQENPSSFDANNKRIS